MSSIIDLTDEDQDQSEKTIDENKQNVIPNINPVANGTILIDDSSSESDKSSQINYVENNRSVDDCCIISETNSSQKLPSPLFEAIHEEESIDTLDKVPDLSQSPQFRLLSPRPESPLLVIPTTPPSQYQPTDDPCQRISLEKRKKKNAQSKVKSKSKELCSVEIPKDFAKFFDQSEESINMLKVFLDEAMINFLLVDVPKIPDTIRWLYEKTDVIDNEVVPTVIESNWLLLLMDGSEYLTKLSAFKADSESSESLLTYLVDFKFRCSDKNIILIVNNLSSCLKLERAKEAKKYRQAFRSTFEKNIKDKNNCPKEAELNFNELGDLRILLQMDLDFEHPDWKVHINFADSVQELVTAIEKYSRAMVLLPTRQFVLMEGIDWAINMDKARAYDPSKSPEDALNLWMAQLQQFPLVTLPVAKAIASQYPSPYALIDQYKVLDKEEGEKLLADIHIQRNMKRQIGMNISKRIYYFATCQDPSVHIGMN